MHRRLAVVTWLALATVACVRSDPPIQGSRLDAAASFDRPVSEVSPFAPRAPDGAVIDWVNELPPAPAACLALGLDPDMNIKETALPSGPCQQQDGLVCPVTTQDICRGSVLARDPQLWLCVCNGGAWECVHVGGARTACSDFSGGGVPPPDAVDDRAPEAPCGRGAVLRDSVCVCAPETPMVCGDACVDLQTDPDNCGGCRHKCPAGTTCQNGDCR